MIQIRKPKRDGPRFLKLNTGGYTDEQKMQVSQTI